MQRIRGVPLVVDGTYVRPATSPTVEVRYLDGNLATIYATNSLHASQVKANPFTGGADGQWDYYIPNTRSTVNVTGGTPAINGTETITDILAFDSASHGLGNLAGVTLTSVASADVLVFNSATNQWVNATLSTVLGYLGGAYVALTGVSCGTPTIKANPTSGFPVLDLVMTGTGWVQAWRTSSGMGGTPVNVGYVDPTGLVMYRATQVLSGGLYVAHASSFGASLFAAGFELSAGSAVAPALARSSGTRAGLFFTANNIPALSSSGGAMTAVLDSRSGFIIDAKTFVGNACGLTTSSAIITASKALAATDFGVTQVCSTATNITLTLSNGAGTVGQVLPIFRAGAGTVTVTSGGAVTILGRQFTVNSLSGASLECIAANVWLFRA